MAQASGRGLNEVLLEVASIYPAAVRYGGGYWSEAVGNASGYAADVLDAMIRIARRPDRSREVLTDLMERYRDYATSVGSTFERALLDFNQAFVKLARAYPDAAARVASPARDPAGDPMTAVFQQLADFAAGEAVKLQGGQGSLDVQSLRQRLESCLAELRKIEGSAGARPGPA